MKIRNTYKPNSKLDSILMERLACQGMEVNAL